MKANLIWSFAVAMLLSFTQAQQHELRGGYPNQLYPSCSNNPCSVDVYCCRFKQEFTELVEYYCLNSDTRQGFLTGAYQDQENYPFYRYNWDCSTDRQYTNIDNY